MTTACTTARPAAPPCSPPTRNSTPARAGRASRRRRSPRTSGPRTTTPTACTASRSCAPIAAATSGTCSRRPRPQWHALLHQFLLAGVQRGNGGYEDLMPHLIRTAQPTLHQPVLVGAFEGWNDAGEAATFAAKFLAERWDAEPFATIDPEDFFDFTSTRPHVQLDESNMREVVWPTTTLSSASV